MPDTLKCKPIVPEMYQDNIHKNNDLDENVALKYGKLALLALLIHQKNDTVPRRLRQIADTFKKREQKLKQVAGSVNDTPLRVALPIIEG